MEQVLLRLERLGGIEDLGLDLRWDAEVLRNEIKRRTAALAAMRIGSQSILAIAHGGTARFFADLLAIWRVGATAACLDPT